MTFRLTYFEKMQKVKKLVLIPHSVHWGINTPSKTPPHLFLPSPPLKPVNYPSPPFQAIPLMHWFLVTPPPHPS